MKWRTELATREGGSEWELIKILLKGEGYSNKTNTATNTRLWLNYPSWSRPHSHWSATGPRNKQPQKPTRECSETNNSSSYWTAPVRPVEHTGQTGPCEITLTETEDFHRRLLHQSGWCSTPVRPVQAKKPQIHEPNLPGPKLKQTRNNNHTTHQGTHEHVHLSKIQLRVGIGQTSERLGKTWALEMNSNPRVNYPKSNSRSTDSLHEFAQDFGDSWNNSWALHSQDLVYRNLLNREESKKTHQEHH
jgi:hypothetical protein